jgi:hypothetical protein
MTPTGWPSLSSTIWLRMVFPPLRVAPSHAGLCADPWNRQHTKVLGSHGVPMKKVEDYRAHADECRSLANRANSPEDKALLMNMAATWESLAPHMDRLARMEKLENPTAASIPVEQRSASNDD